MNTDGIRAAKPAAGTDSTEVPEDSSSAGVPADRRAVLREVQDLRARLEENGIAVPGSPACARPATWRRATLGGPVPMVAVATTGADAAACAEQARAARRAGADLVELRADLLTAPEAAAATGRARAATTMPARWAPQELAGLWLAAARAVGAELCGSDMPVLLTVRTAAEGGGLDVDDVTYRAALADAIERVGRERGAAAAVDVELARGDLPRLVRLARRAGLDVVASSHDFAATPDDVEMLRRLHAMQDAGAAVAKLAVTPADPADVERLVGVAARARGELDIPVVAIAMGEAGVLTRLAGGVFGSALTFATAGSAASAPGQLPVARVREALALLHS
ncbi:MULTISPECIES: type I 3-dehydroquinate dehydratase [unclassified Actinomyces]|uniref:type I 3-dehydroquinate dehydratase n=1 Tax=unclassified Actinomyces TaxID=2609248 RepID=UPI000D593389|nr:MULTISPECIES: type I 3-dehydroquinate dehydratase [unclassified Actinomyces]RAX24491.1 type I 3-dehydroquinate dehydratase [Actinomyces sp. Z3]